MTAKAKTRNQKPTKRTTLSEFAAVQIQPAQIVQSPTNARDTQTKLETLKASIQERGILNPLTVRRIENGKYEVVAGARRLAAAIELELATVPAIVRDLDEDEARTVALIDNIERADLTPLEEARGIQYLYKMNLDTDDIAKRLARTPQFIARRHQLLALSKDWKDRFADPESPVSKWPIRNLELLATFAPEVQNNFFADNPWIAGREVSLADFGNVIARYTADLSAAPWDLESPHIFPQAGACTTCDFRSRTQPLLFESDETADRCLRPGCYQEKLKLHSIGLAKKLASDSNLICALHDGPQEAAPILLTHNYDQIPKDFVDVGAAVLTSKDRESSHLIETKSHDHRSKPAVWIDGPDAGKPVWIKEDTRKAKKDPTGEQDRTPQERQEEKREQFICKKLRENLLMYQTADNLEGLILILLEAEQDEVDPHHFLEVVTAKVIDRAIKRHFKNRIGLIACLYLIDQQQAEQVIDGIDSEAKNRFPDITKPIRRREPDRKKASAKDED